MEDFRDYDPSHHSTPPHTIEYDKKSWVGKMTSTILTLTQDSIILNSIAEGLSDQDNGDSGSGRALKLFAFVAAGLMVLCVVYGLGRIIQVVVGKEIVMKKEIIVIEEVKLSDVLGDNSDGGSRVGTVARDKKKKNR